jgi:hypothetical protein
VPSVGRWVVEQRLTALAVLAPKLAEPSEAQRWLAAQLSQNRFDQGLAIRVTGHGGLQVERPGERRAHTEENRIPVSKAVVLPV